MRRLEAKADAVLRRRIGRSYRIIDRIEGMWVCSYTELRCAG